MLAFQNYKFDPVPRRGSIEILNSDVSIVNGIRRMLLTDVPYIAFRAEPFEQSTIQIEKNTGPLHNEFISHRIGLLPICFPLDQISKYQDGDLEFTVSVKNTETTMRSVTTDDFEVRLHGDKIPTHNIFPHDPHTKMPIVITRLRKGEEFIAKGQAVKGCGRDHAGFCPVSLCTYRFIESKEAAKVADILQKERTFIKNDHGEATAFLFQIESECGHTFHDIFLYAIDYLISKLVRLISNTPIAKLDSEQTVADFTFEGEDDTLGNLFGLVFNKYIREEELFNGKKVTYIGQYCPHPLELRLVHRVCIENGELSDYQQFIQEELRFIHGKLMEFRAAFAPLNATVFTDIETIPEHEPVATIVDVDDTKQKLYENNDAQEINNANDNVNNNANANATRNEDVQQVETEEIKYVSNDESVEFFTSKNISAPEALKLPKTTNKLLNMRFTDRLALVLKDYKVNRKSLVQIMHAEVGPLAWSFAQRFTNIQATDENTVMQTVMKENIITLQNSKDKVKGKIDILNELPSGNADLLVFNAYSSASSMDDWINEIITALSSGVKPTYIAMICPKRTEPEALQKKWQAHGWNLYMKEFVLKEIKLTVWGQGSSTTSSN